MRTGRSGHCPYIYEFCLESVLTQKRGAREHFPPPTKSPGVQVSSCPLGHIWPSWLVSYVSEMRMELTVACRTSVFTIWPFTSEKVRPTLM